MARLTEWRGEHAADVVERGSFEAVGQKYAQIQDKLIRGEIVPVVRCWECKHWNTHQCPMCHEEYYYDDDDGGDYYDIDKAVDPDGFCSYGERKDGEG